MESRILRVVSQTDVVNVPSKKVEGGQVAKCVIRLKEPGGDYEDEYLATVFGNLALVKFMKGELVLAVLEFRTHESNGTTYQDVIAKELVKMKCV